MVVVIISAKQQGETSCSMVNLTLSHLSAHVVNSLLLGNQKSISKIFNC